MITKELVGEAATQAVGLNIAKQLDEGLVIYLEGELGAGKTTLVRAMLRGMGVTGAVRSPTYTLIEQYGTQPEAWHLDLYRLADPEELDFVGIRDVDVSKVVLLVEWSQRGEGFLPEADWLVSLSYTNDCARTLEVTPKTQRGGEKLNMIQW